MRSEHTNGIMIISLLVPLFLGKRVRLSLQIRKANPKPSFNLLFPGSKVNNKEPHDATDHATAHFPIHAETCRH